MSKSDPSEEDKRRRVRASKPRALVSISLVLSLVVTAVALANWRGSKATTQGSKEKKNGEMTIENFSAGSPSKEYVYAGGRLVATEECGYSISPADAFYLLNGSQGVVNLTAGVGCAWTAISSNPDWLTITSASSGTVSGPINYVVRDNFTGVPRQGTLTIAGLTFTVTQAGFTGECIYVISPTKATFGPSGGSGSVSVFTDALCAWQAVSNASWVTVTSGCCRIGDGTVTYSVAPNTGPGRAATITIGNRTFNVKQTAGGG